MSLFSRWLKKSRQPEASSDFASVMDAFFNQGEDTDNMLSAAENEHAIRNVLSRYSLNLDGGRLSVSRGQAAGRSTDTLAQITDIYWRLKASGASEELARAVINKEEHLTTYLEMKADDVADVPLADRLRVVFNK